MQDLGVSGTSVPIYTPTKKGPELDPRASPTPANILPFLFLNFEIESWSS